MENVEVEFRTKKPVSQSDLWKIKKYTDNAFNKIGSDNYRQKIVYKLLNTTKSSNQKEFFSILLRTLNGQKANEDVKKLSDKLQEIYPLTPESFENVAYSIIMGIMSAESNGGN